MYKNKIILIILITNFFSNIIKEDKQIENKINELNDYIIKLNKIKIDNIDINYYEINKEKLNKSINNRAVNITEVLKDFIVKYTWKENIIKLGDFINLDKNKKYNITNIEDYFKVNNINFREYGKNIIQVSYNELFKNKIIKNNIFELTKAENELIKEKVIEKYLDLYYSINEKKSKYKNAKLFSYKKFKDSYDKYVSKYYNILIKLKNNQNKNNHANYNSDLINKNSIVNELVNKIKSNKFILDNINQLLNSEYFSINSIELSNKYKNKYKNKYNLLLDKYKKLNNTLTHLTLQYDKLHKKQNSNLNYIDIYEKEKIDYLANIDKLSNKIYNTKLSINSKKILIKNKIFNNIKLDKKVKKNFNSIENENNRLKSFYTVLSKQKFIIDHEYKKDKNLYENILKGKNTNKKIDRIGNINKIFNEINQVIKFLYEDIQIISYKNSNKIPLVIENDVNSYYTNEDILSKKKNLILRFFTKNIKFMYPVINNSIIIKELTEYFKFYEGELNWVEKYYFEEIFEDLVFIKGINFTNNIQKMFQDERCELN